MSDIAEGVAVMAAVTGLDDEAIGELVDRARAEGVSLTGPDGLLGQLTKKVLESALEGEMVDHVGYEPGDPAGRNRGNSRNGHRAKTAITEAGPIEIDVPRDRDSRNWRRWVASSWRSPAKIHTTIVVASWWSARWGRSWGQASCAGAGRRPTRTTRCPSAAASWVSRVPM